MSQPEFERLRRARYADTDADGNGRVDAGEYRDEFAARLALQQGRQRARQIGQLHTRFAALDGDRDGRVDRGEYAASGERMFADYGAMRVTGDEATASTRSAGGLPSTHTRQGMRALYDGDGDGQVQRAEFDTGRERAFARTDRNGDGRLDPEEYLSDYRQRLDRGLASERAAALQR